MNVPLWRRWLALLGVMLSACASSAPGVVGGSVEDVDPVASWEEARADPSCVVPLCDEEERCAFWRCQDVVEVEARPVLLAFAHGSLRPPCVRVVDAWSHLQENHILKTHPSTRCLPLSLPTCARGAAGALTGGGADKS
jgi:hypothetical protein